LDNVSQSSGVIPVFIIVNYSPMRDGLSLSMIK